MSSPHPDTFGRPESTVAELQAEVARLGAENDELRAALKADGQQQDAARWQEAVQHVGADRRGGVFLFTLRTLSHIRGTNPLQGAVGQHFTAAIDAAITANPGAGGDHGQKQEAQEAGRGDACEVMDGDPESPTFRAWLPARFVALDLIGGEPIVQREGAMPIFATWGSVRGFDGDPTNGKNHG